MSQIRKNIENGDYNDLTSLMQDFNLMLNNARSYNIPDSRIYKDAVTTQNELAAAAVPLLRYEKVGCSKSCISLFNERESSDRGSGR